MATTDKTKPKKTVRAVKKAVTPSKTVEKPQPNVSQKAEDYEYYDLMPIAVITTRTGLNRATVADRLNKHGYKPVAGHEKLKIYEFDEKMEADLLETNTKLSEAKVRREESAARLNELKVEQIEGTLVPFGEVVDVISNMFGSLYKETVTRLPKRLASRLARSTTASDVTQILTHELDKIFQDVRANSGKYTGEGKKEKAA